jgi:hypothetical protein
MGTTAALDKFLLEIRSRWRRGRESHPETLIVIMAGQCQPSTQFLRFRLIGWKIKAAVVGVPAITLAA